jgi:hypothetical protein
VLGLERGKNYTDYSKHVNKAFKMSFLNCVLALILTYKSRSNHRPKCLAEVTLGRILGPYIRPVYLRRTISHLFKYIPNK